MMYTELYQYLIKYHRLNVPGLGTFLLERRPAQGDFPNKRIDPPGYAIALLQAETQPSRKLFTWLAAALGISSRDAVVRFNDFSFELKKNISAGGSVNWNGIGILSRGLAGEIKFTPNSGNLLFELPVIAEKVIRDKAEHIIKVGEEERTSSQMTEILLSQPEPAVKRSYWWAWALVFGLLGFMFLGWYFSEHGLDPSSTANQQKLKPVEATATYKTP